MKILDGDYRRRPLRFEAGVEARPTARRLRESLFEFLAIYIPGARFLDLCAGTGAVGIEALSRGAASVTFVDRAGEACRLVESNLIECGAAPSRVEVFNEDAAEFLERVRGTRVWDVAFYDPPYSADYVPVLNALASGEILSRARGVVAVEHHCERRLPNELGSLRRWRMVRAGASCLSFYEQRRRPARLRI